MLLPQGEVIDVRDIEAIVDAYVALGKSWKFINLEMQRKEFTMLCKKIRVIAALKEYPLKPIFVGQNWDTHQDNSSETIMTTVSGQITNHWRLNSINNGLAYLTKEYEGQSQVITDMGEPTKDKASASVEHSGNSEIQVHLLTGLVKYSKTTSKGLTHQLNSDELHEPILSKLTTTTTTIIELLEQ